MARRKPVKPFPYFRHASGSLPVNTLPPRVDTIPVARIKGSVDKAGQLTPTFLPKKENVRSSRFRSIMQALARGVELPPIEVYYVKREYYVIDGHHRVAAAIANGVKYIDAVVHECIVPEKKPADYLANVRVRFERRTGLNRIDFTKPESYARLLTEILAYRDNLRRTDPDVSTREAARRWYREVFVPIAEPLDLGATTLAFPGRTVSDLYFAVRDHQAYLEQESGTPVSAADAVADLQKRHPRPITARVLRPLQRHARRAVWRMTGGPPAL
jgi:ParB/Sulfiredoxin domain